jgi:hypothetical protein
MEISSGPICPKEGQSLQALATMDAASHLGPNLQIDPAAGTAKISMDKLQEIFCLDCTVTQMNAISMHYRDEPIAPFAAPAHVTDASWGKVTKYYVFTKQDNAVSYAMQQTMTTGAALPRRACNASAPRGRPARRRGRRGRRA